MVHLDKKTFPTGVVSNNFGKIDNLRKKTFNIYREIIYLDYLLTIYWFTVQSVSSEI